MEDLEKKIKEAGDTYTHSRFEIQLAARKMSEAFVDGAKSPEAKAYWQEGMYTDNEVLELLYLAFGEKLYSKERIKEWFEANKKKS